MKSCIDYTKRREVKTMNVEEYFFLSNIEVFDGEIFISCEYLQPHPSVEVAKKNDFIKLNEYLKKFDALYHLDKFPYLNEYRCNRNSMGLVDAYKSLLAQYYPSEQFNFDIEELNSSLSKIASKIWDKEAKKRINHHRGIRLPMDFEIEVKKMIPIITTSSLEINKIHAIKSSVEKYVLDNIDTYYRLKDPSYILSQDEATIIKLVGIEYLELFKDLTLLLLEGGNI